MQNQTLAQINIKLGRCEFPFFYRANSVGDNGVIRQVFKELEYRLDAFRQRNALFEFYQKKTSSGEKALIIDAGANIGASTAFFACLYNTSLVYAIEPEARNFHILQRNCASLSNVRAFNGAIDCEDGNAYLEVSGRSDWGFRLSANGEVPVPVVSPNTILHQLGREKAFPFIFKIDIEGGEADLFSRNLEWINSFPLIVIELHDWMLPFQGISRSFIKAMANHDFDIVHRGENTFCFNRRLLAPICEQ